MDPFKDPFNTTPFKDFDKQVEQMRESMAKAHSRTFALATVGGILSLLIGLSIFGMVVWAFGHYGPKWW